MRAQRLVDVVDDGDVFHVVERIGLELAGVAQRLLHLLHAGFGERDGALLLVDLVVGLVELRDVGVDGVVEIGAVVERPGNDQRRARFVDQDGVDLVDDGEDVAALHHVLEPVLHVVAQIVEAELVVGAVGDVALVFLLALLVVEAVDDDADRQPEEFVDLAHPFGVALGQVIVDGDDVDAAAGERVEIDRQRRDQRLAFAGLHLGNLAVVQHHAADHLHVEMALAERALGGLAHGGESRHQDVVERLAVGELLLEFVGARAQRLVGELFELGLQRIDRRRRATDTGGCAGRLRTRTACGRLRRSSHYHPFAFRPRHKVNEFVAATWRPPVANMAEFPRDRRNVQLTENAALFGLLQNDNATARMRGNHRPHPLRHIGGGGFLVNATPRSPKRQRGQFFDCKARRIRRVSAPNSAPGRLARRARRPGQLLGQPPGQGEGSPANLTTLQGSCRQAIDRPICPCE